MDPAAPSPLRIPAVDVARGVALLAMFVYHFTWDLGFFGFITLQAGVDPGWRLFAKLIAGSFLVLVGVSLVLATRDGVKPRPFLRRLAMVSAAAIAVTVATLYATPQSFVFFGILHAIAVFSVLALPLLRAPLWWIAMMAAFVAVAPLAFSSPTFDSPGLWWLGLMPKPPLTNDFVPVFPWFAAVLVGVLAARTGIAAGLDRRLAAWTPGRIGAVLAWGGRHSLAVYLVHQPVFFGILSLAVAAGAPKAGLADPASFATACTRSCSDTGTDAGFCRKVCTCVGERLDDPAMALRASRGALTPADEQRIRDLAEACR